MSSLISLNFRSGGPIYLQLKEEVIRLACIGLLQPDEQLPSVRALARELGINPNTVAKAYQELENEGFIYSVGGRGSFVSGDILATEGVRREAKLSFCQAAEKARRVGVGIEQLRLLLDQVYSLEAAEMKRGEKNDTM